MFERIRERLFGSKLVINEGFTPEQKSIIMKDKRVRNIYKEKQYVIEATISDSFGQSINMNNIFVALQANLVDEYITIYNKDVSLMDGMDLSIEELKFIVKYHDMMKYDDFAHCKELVQMDEGDVKDYLSNDNRFALPFEVVITPIGKKITKYPNILKKIIKEKLPKILSQLESFSDEDLEFLENYIVDRDFPFPESLKLVSEEYRNKIEPELFDLINLRMNNDAIIGLIDKGNSTLVNDYLNCKKYDIFVKELSVDANNITELVTQNNGFQRLLIERILNCKKVYRETFNAMMNCFEKTTAVQQINEGYITPENLPESLEPYRDIIEMVAKICRADSYEELRKISDEITSQHIDYSDRLIDMDYAVGNYNREQLLSSARSTKTIIDQKMGQRTIDGVPIIDFMGEKYSMLVHTFPSDKLTSRTTPRKKGMTVCCSMISEKASYLYHEGNIFGFFVGDEMAVAQAGVRNIGSNNSATEECPSVVSPKEIFDKNTSSHNEVDIFYTEDQTRPCDYIVCFNAVTEDALSTAKKFSTPDFQIPIYVIHTAYYPNTPMNKNFRNGEDKALVDSIKECEALEAELDQEEQIILPRKKVEEIEEVLEETVSSGRHL